MQKHERSIDATGSEHARKLSTLVTGAILLALGLVGLGAWYLGIPILRSLHPSWVEMKMSSAIGMVLCGLCLLALQPSLAGRRFHQPLALAITLLGAFGLLQSVAGLDFGIDDASMQGLAGKADTHMAPLISLNFVLIGLAFLLATASGRAGNLCIAAALTVAALSLPPLISYLYGGRSSAEMFSIYPMAIQTAAGFLLAGAGVALARPAGEAYSAICSNSLGSVVIRRTLPWVFLVPLILGGVAAFAMRGGYIASADGVAALAVWMIALLSASILLSAKSLNRADREKNAAMTLLKEANEKLDEKIRERTAALTETRDQVRILMNGLQDCAIWSLDAEGRVNSWNEGAERLWGCSPQDVLGKAYATLFHADYAEDEAAADAMLKTAIEREWYEHEGWRTDARGRRRWIRELIASLMAADGGRVGFLVLSRDVTDQLSEASRRVDAEKAAMNAANRLETIIEASPVAIISLDENSNVSVWNRRATELFGFTAEEAIGRPSPIVPKEQTDERHQLVETAVSYASVAGVVKRRCRKDGVLIDVRITAAALQDESGQPVGAVYLLEDIREQLETERKLFQAQKMEAVGQLTGGIAHDFNNLLAIIIGNLDLALEDPGTDDGLAELLKPALSASLRGAELTRQMLAFSRRQMLQAESFYVTERLYESKDILERALGQNIEIRLELGNAVWPVRVDPVQFDSAVLNLAINARDAMPDGGKLIIKAHNAHLDADYARLNPSVTAGDYVAVAVSDTGIGIVPELLERVFEPFFTTKIGMGSGLGLSMVYGFIKQSGGHVKVYSEIGHGTTVRMYIPRAAAAGAATQSILSKVSEKGASTHGWTILVVEDNPEVRDLTVRQLEDMGFRVSHAGTGEEALVMLKATPGIDLLFTDVVLGSGMTGPAVAKAARELDPAIRVVFASGFADSRQTGDLLDKGATLLHKPYRRHELETVLHNALKINGDPP